MLVDVMMPFYGDFTQFRQAVLSVLYQTHRDFRITIVDDCHPDDAPRRWAESLADERVVYLRNETNLGVNANFRRCVELVTADYFVVMGCDDAMGPGYLARVVELAATYPRAAVIAPGVQIIDDTGAVVRPLGDRIKRRLAPREAVVLSGQDLAVSLLHGNWTYFPSLLWRTEAVREVGESGFREGLDVVLDLALLLDLTVAGGALVYDPRVVFSYRRHAASVSSVLAVDGDRFTEESDFFAAEARRYAALGWPRAERAAKLHLTSRLHHALARLRAVRHR
ncbi:MAG: glycosyltransferase family 2 protein, partial [Gordonia amarae]